MLVGDKVSHSAVTEAYCLLSAYVREDGKLGTTYKKDELQKFLLFVSEILNHPENFVDAKEEKSE